MDLRAQLSAQPQDARRNPGHLLTESLRQQTIASNRNRPALRFGGGKKGSSYKGILHRCREAAPVSSQHLVVNAALVSLSLAVILLLLIEMDSEPGRRQRRALGWGSEIGTLDESVRDVARCRPVCVMFTHSIADSQAVEPVLEPIRCLNMVGTCGHGFA